MRLLLATILFVGGCSSSNSVTSNHWSVEALQMKHTHRTAQFNSLVGRGVIGFKWTDDQGTHKEQGGLDFWKQGNAVSLRISKLGELIAWFGGEGQEYWFFDLMGEEPTLTIGGEHGMFNDIEVALILLGLAPLPDGKMTNSDGVVTLVDDKQRRWVATFDTLGNRPLTIEFIDGDHIAKANHQNGIRVEIDQLHELHWPETGGLIDMTDSQGNTEIKIVFSSLSTIVEDEPMHRVMDLEYLRGALNPTIVLEDD
jgi:hypothetical protein